jgi:MoxR-like ATPase
MTQPQDLIDALSETIVGQHDVIESLLLALLSNGHVLLEGPPGLAKTLACRSLAAALDGEFKRIQFTPDLLPSDIVGTRVFDQRETNFATVLGPIFANVVLADEINRAPAKVQSALLEAMQERQVTIGPQTHPLPDPFVVMATMNPLDSEGTYALPVAQMDRFLMKVNVGYPTRDQELSILNRFAVADTQPRRAVATLDDVRSWRERAHAVHIDEKLKGYIVELVAITREADRVNVQSQRGATLHANELIDYGASPRDFALPDDVRAVAPYALRHRIGFNYRVTTEGVSVDRVIEALVAAIPAP